MPLIFSIFYDISAFTQSKQLNSRISRAPVSVSGDVLEKCWMVAAVAPPLLHHLLHFLSHLHHFLLLLLQISSLFKASHSVCSHHAHSGVKIFLHASTHFGACFIWWQWQFFCDSPLCGSVHIWSYLAPWGQIIRKSPFLLLMLPSLFMFHSFASVDFFHVF